MNLDFGIIPKYLPMFFRSIGVTMQVTLLSLLVGFVLAIPLTLCKISRSRILRGFAQFYSNNLKGAIQ